MSKTVLSDRPPPAAALPLNHLLASLPPADFGRLAIRVRVSTHVLASWRASLCRSAHPTTVSDRTRVIVAAVVAFVGFVWMLQGLGVPIGGGFMVGNPMWVVVGAALVVLAGLYGAWPRLRRR